MHFYIRRRQWPIWAVILPAVAVLATAALLVAADRDERAYYSEHPYHHLSLPPSVNDYSPYPVAAAFLINGPFFVPLPLPPRVDILFSDRLYSVAIGWFCIGLYLDWKRNHPSVLVPNRVARILLFSACSLVFVGLTIAWTRGFIGDIRRAEAPFAVFWSMRFHTALAVGLVIQTWFVALTVWFLWHLSSAYRSFDRSSAVVKD